MPEKPVGFGFGDAKITEPPVCYKNFKYPIPEPYKIIPDDAVLFVPARND